MNSREAIVLPGAAYGPSAPLLMYPSSAAQARGATDELWDSTLARELTQYVLEVEDADHGMYVPGPLAGAAAVLGQVVTAVEQFLDDVVWR
jgi:hypothetical protein